MNDFYHVNSVVLVLMFLISQNARQSRICFILLVIGKCGMTGLIPPPSICHSRLMHPSRVVLLLYIEIHIHRITYGVHRSIYEN